MSRKCEICGRKSSVGNTITRSGSPKYKGGIGLHTGGITKRRFYPNIQRIKVLIDGEVKHVRVCTSCMKAGKVQRPPARPSQLKASAEREQRRQAAEAAEAARVAAAHAAAEAEARAAEAEAEAQDAADAARAKDEKPRRKPAGGEEPASKKPGAVEEPAAKKPEAPEEKPKKKPEASEEKPKKKQEASEETEIPAAEGMRMRTEKPKEEKKP